MNEKGLRWSSFFALLTCIGCDALEGQRYLLPKADTSLFVPSNWETEATDHTKDTDGAVLEAHPRTGKSGALRGIKLNVFTKPEAAGLQEMVTQALLDVARLEKQGTLKVLDVTQIELTRRGFAAMRIVHQLQLGKGTQALEVTQYTDLLFRPGLGVVLLVGGPKQGIDEVAPEIDRIMSSVRSLIPEPEIERPVPPPYVTMTFPRALQRIFLNR